jgi:hypothetical protein
LFGRKIPQDAAIKITFNPSNYLGRSDHIHAAGQFANDINAQPLWPVALVPIAQRKRSRSPTTTVSTTRKLANGVNELMLRICLPMDRFAATRDNHAGPVQRAFTLDVDGGGQMHQRRDAAKYALGMIDQPH